MPMDVSPGLGGCAAPVKRGGGGPIVGTGRMPIDVSPGFGADGAPVKRFVLETAYTVRQPLGAVGSSTTCEALPPESLSSSETSALSPASRRFCAFFAWRAWISPTAYEVAIGNSAEKSAPYHPSSSPSRAPLTSS